MRIEWDVSGWDRLLGLMGARASEWLPVATNGAGGAPAWLIQLQTSGIEVALEEVDRTSKGLFTYKGQQVLIYIKDTQQSAELLVNTPESGKRFHFMDCTTIQDMKAKQRFQRYVAIARPEGTFPVFTREEDGSSLAIEAPLRVCKNCLKDFDYRGYRSRPPGALPKGRIWEGFDIAQFFTEAQASFATVPAVDGRRALPNQYTADWPEVSRKARERASWSCTSCGVDCNEARDLLQVHHVNGVKTDNAPGNLRVLCVECHARQPMHDIMHVPHTARQRLADLRVSQGL